jgi:hypothetical protein
MVSFALLPAVNNLIKKTLEWRNYCLDVNMIAQDLFEYSNDSFPSKREWFCGHSKARVYLLHGERNRVTRLEKEQTQ